MRIAIKSNKVVTETYTFVKFYDYKVILEKDTVNIDNCEDAMEELHHFMQLFKCETELTVSKSGFVLNVKD